MNAPLSRLLLLAGLSIGSAHGLPSAARAAARARVTSPDGIAALEFSLGKTLSYSVSWRGKPVVLPSPIALDLEGGGPLGAGLKIEKQSKRPIDGTWQALHGKRSQVRDHANELTLELAEIAGAKRKLILIARAYDDGVAFRYRIPVQPGLETFRLKSESTAIRFASDHAVWAANYGSFVSSQEHEFHRTSVDQVSERAFVGLPLLVDAGGKDGARWLAVTEADLFDWAGMYLKGAGQSHALVTTLSPRPDQPGIVVVGDQRRQSPWRVFLLGENPGALIEADLVRNLAEPNRLSDTSWIKPGRAAWDRWWSGDHAPDAKFKYGMNTATMKDFIDLAALMDWEYQIVDWTWYGKPEDPAADLTRVIPEVDMPGLVKYAADRKVKLWLWARWNHMDRQMDTALPLFHTWGIAGIKVDFMDRDDQLMVNFYERLVRLAAENQLMVDLHGAFKPTGMERTYPNLLTREGVMGNEYNKWSNRITPTHKTTLPFTRMLAGPMDFTPGGMRHSVPGSFVAKDTAPTVMGTRASELALAVVYESGLDVFCDAPSEYRANRDKGVEFLKQVPAAWDETKVIEGYPGLFITIARRSRDTWYVAGLTADAERTAHVPLTFLGPGDFRFHSWSDAADAAKHPEKIVESERRVSAKDTLHIELAPAGGFAAVLSPVR